MKLATIAVLCLAADLMISRQPHAQQTREGETGKTPPVAGPEEGARPTPLSVPPPDVLLMLMRTTLVALNQANFTGNYTVLHGLGTPQLQARNSPAQLGIAFTNLRDQKLDLSPILVLTPELTKPPSLSQDSTLRLEGVFRTTPVQISFVTVFRPVTGIWRVEDLSVSAIPVPVQAALTPDLPAAKEPKR